MMLFLVTGENLLVLFVGWEGVGIASYLLINFWFIPIAIIVTGVGCYLFYWYRNRSHW
jgi:NADH-ubiquinone oxidoreductase chain 5